jgi:alkanesulfonate monooxygenase SsuD/methylene tetrahydromethanopterin reductase-like flavin-dependent oxidoreductase (luciferase family)
MEVGIGLPSTIPGAGRDDVLEWARRAEARGFSTLGTLDRIVYPGHEPLVALAAAAAVTDRIRLATTILLAPTRANGALLAKQAATLDVLSGGRLVLGVAVGRREDDFRATGADFHGRGRALDAMLDLCTRIWAGEEFGSKGGIGPPLHTDRPSLILGGLADAAFRRAARYSDGWTAGNGTPEELATGTERLRAAWAAAGRNGVPRTMVQPYFALGEGAEAAADGYLRDYYDQPGEYVDTVVARAATDAATVRDNVRAFEAAGCDEVIFFPCDADPDQVDRLADALA